MTQAKKQKRLPAPAKQPAISKGNPQSRKALWEKEGQRNDVDAQRPAGRNKVKFAATRRRGPQTAQQTIPYREMHRDGICRVQGGYYTKSISYEDINYAVAAKDDKAHIFDGYCSFLNYFDDALPFQMSFMKRRTRPEDRQAVNFPRRQDGNERICREYSGIIKAQDAKSNNGFVLPKYITFGMDADSLKTARHRLDRVEADIMGNYKRLGVRCRPMTGRDRLEALHTQLHPGGRDPFRFEWEQIAQTGMSTKDFIAPDSFDFRQSRMFRVGTAWGAASYMQIMASELSDRLLAEILEVDAEMTVTMHVKAIDQAQAIKNVKTKLTDISRMKVDEQKKAARSGYDMDILPPDLVTFSKDAAELLADLQSRNERMFLLTFLVVNVAPTRQQLENDIFTVSGVTQKHNCFLKRLDFQQEQGFMSSLPLGYNGIEIQRGMTTSSTAIFVPFMTQELRMGGPSIYYGMNALSHNIIMADRKKLKSANGLYLGSTGCLVGETKIRLANGEAVSLRELAESGAKEFTVKAYDELTEKIVDAPACDARISKETGRLKKIYLDDGTVISCTDNHLFLDEGKQYVPADEITAGQMLYGGHVVVRVAVKKLPHKIPVYDITVPQYTSFVLENGVVVHNSGKSFAAKRELIHVVLATNDRVFVVDPMGEYAPLIEKLGGQVLELAPDSDHHINPMDMQAGIADGESPLSLKADFLLSLCELIVGGRDGLQPIEKTVIDRCVRTVYRDMVLHPETAKTPRLQDLYELLSKQPEPEAQRIATALELYCTGSLNLFNHQTNVNLNSRIVCIVLKKLGDGLRKIAMHITNELVTQAVNTNYREGRATWCYFDEFHVLLQDSLSASYFVRIWKMLRKKGCVPSALTQNVKDLFASREIENILENTDFYVLLSQAQGDRAILAKHLSISEHQLSYITHSQSGEGLLFYGDIVIPFVDRFPPGEIYDLLTTRPEDVAKAAQNE